MKKIKIFFSTFLRVVYTLAKVKTFSINNDNAEYIIWVPNFFNFRSFISGDNFQKVFFTYHYLKKENKEVTIYSRKNIGKFSKKNIILFASTYYNLFSFKNYTNSLINIVEQLEYQGNIVFPNIHEIKLWENKGYMHEFFEKKLIRTPDTEVYKKSIFDFNKVKFNYPFLIKDEHACSAQGLYKINSQDELKLIIFNKNYRLMNNKFIFQKLLNIKKDLRIIFVGNEIILHYWRINLSKNWKPTSTSFGSKVDFQNFPEQWRSWLIDCSKKIGIRTGAYDVAWENDDLNSEPYILEVSPFYQPNPEPKNEYDLKNYGEWKKSLRLRSSYQVAISEIISTIQKKFVKSLIKTSNKN